ncbi:unnamed protein product [Paramecium sonneborni]|uniref:Uncharacterized protein n=1 Tax=Paramecium sonneborni TaxID=65129 RepID=A0A8S1Q0M1_9CILI|nr:unnamed protein product [Paramecium sonneborni]
MVKQQKIQYNYYSFSIRFQQFKIELLYDDVNINSKTLSKANKNPNTTILINILFSVIFRKKKRKKLWNFNKNFQNQFKFLFETTKNPSIFIKEFTIQISDFKKPQNIQYIKRVCVLILQIIQKEDQGRPFDNINSNLKHLLLIFINTQTIQLIRDFFESLISSTHKFDQ